MICDDADKRGTLAEQLVYLENTSFVLASNKSSTNNNDIINIINELKQGECNISSAIEKIKTIQTKSKDILEYRENILALNSKALEVFIKNISFELDEQDVFEKCELAIKSAKVLDHKIKDVFRAVDSQIRKDDFLAVKKGSTNLITFDSFYSKYRKFFDLGRNEDLIITKYQGGLPKELGIQTFIKQLVEINDVKSDDFEEMAILTRSMLGFKGNIENWKQAGELTGNEILEFKDNATNQWRNAHKKSIRGLDSASSENEYNRKALEVIDELRGNNLIINKQILPIDLSNATFYVLSDVPIIGWRKDWDKYKSEE